MGERPIRGLVLVYALLLALAALTTGLSFLDLGRWSFAVAMIVAGFKAALVTLYFMHLREGPRLTWVLAGTGLYILAILLGLTFNDFRTRSWLSPFIGGAP